MLFILILSICLTPIHTICTCSDAYLDQPCPNPPCLPNAPWLNAGVDMTDMTYRGQVLGLEWGSNYYYNTANSQYYNTPRGVSILPLSESDDITGTILLKDTEYSEKWQADSYVSKDDYIIGMCSHTTDTYQSITSQFQQNSQVGWVLYYYAFYDVLVPFGEQKVGPDCYKNLVLLPSVYDQIAYLEFIESYGTHYIVESKWGLKYKFMSSYKQCIINTHSESYAYDQVETDGWIHSSEHTTESQSSSTDSYYSSRRYTIETFDGGNLNYHDSTMWDQWVQSGANMENPVPISLKLKPIYMIINDTIKKDNMMRAYHEYFSIKKQQQDNIIEKKKLEPRSVTWARFETGGSSGFYYPNYVNGPIVSKLSSGQSGPLFGENGPCVHLSKHEYNIFKMFGMTPGTQLQTFYCPSMFYCQRNGPNNVRAMHWYPTNEVVGVTKPNTDCSQITVFKVDPYSQTNTSYVWTYQGSATTRGEEISEPYVSPQVKNQLQYYVDYNSKALPSIYQYQSQINAIDGYDNSVYSMTNYIQSIACGGYGVCLMDCDGGISVSFDAHGAPTNVECSC